MFGSSIWFWILAALIASPVLINFSREKTYDFWSHVITASVVVGAAAMPYFGFGSREVIEKFLLAQTLLMASFVCVSRIRQRKSLFLQALAGIGSNGGWFLAMQVLAGAYLAQKQGLANAESVGLLIAAIAGTITGRLVGAQWMMWVEKRWQVTTESVGSPVLKRLDEATHANLALIFIATFAIYGLLSLGGAVSILDVSVVMFLGFLQSQIYTINTRFANRNHPGWPVVTGLIGGIVFMVHWTYLIGYTRSGGFMPISLMIPYTVATVYGGNAGAVLSMSLERVLNLKADAHVKKGEAFSGVSWHRTVLLGTAIFCGIYLVAGAQFLNMLGIAVNPITLPFTLFAGTGWERPIAMAIGGLVFFLNNATHTLSSRAGNRNHAPYHAMTCLLHGVVTFMTGTFVVLNAHYLELIPVAAFGSALGQLLSQKLSMKMEQLLQSVMDVPEESKKAKTA